jgi:hypothetical protein
MEAEKWYVGVMIGSSHEPAFGADRYVEVESWNEAKALMITVRNATERILGGHNQIPAAPAADLQQQIDTLRTREKTALQELDYIAGEIARSIDRFDRDGVFGTQLQSALWHLDELRKEFRSAA